MVPVKAEKVFLIFFLDHGDRFHVSRRRRWPGLVRSACQKK